MDIVSILVGGGRDISVNHKCNRNERGETSGHPVDSKPGALGRKNLKWEHSFEEILDS